MQNARRRKLGNTPLVSANACRAWRKQGISDDESIAIRQHLHSGLAYQATAQFEAMTVA
jgi:putative transposase